MLLSLSNHNAIEFNFVEIKPLADGEKVTLSNLDFYSRKAFPPCMKSLLMTVRN